MEIKESLKRITILLEKNILEHKFIDKWEIITSLFKLLVLNDTDLGPQDPLLRFQYSNTHTHGLQTSCGGKGPVGEKGRHGHSLKRRVPLSASATPSRGERQDPCGDQPL